MARMGVPDAFEVSDGCVKPPELSVELPVLDKLR